MVLIAFFQTALKLLRDNFLQIINLKYDSNELSLFYKINYLIKRKMGNEIDSPGKQVNLINSSYVFVNSKDDLNYGEIKIYSRKGGSDLVAIITRSFSKESQK
jgi:hypothetical protein